jgi:hypothetical protein
MILMLLVGQFGRSEMISEYRKQSGIIYPVLNRDPEHLTLWLAGKRCYKPLPAVQEWNATRNQYEPSYYPKTYQIIDEHSADAVNRVRC